MAVHPLTRRAGFDCAAFAAIDYRRNFARLFALFSARRLLILQR